MIILIWFTLIVDRTLGNPPFQIVNEEIDPKFWETLARKEFKDRIGRFASIYEGTKSPKSVILFLGDGMGLPTIAAGRFHKAELEYKLGQSLKHSFEFWDFASLSRTYDLETMVTDSASSATAYLTGSKTRTGMLGLTGAVKVKECRPYNDSERLTSIGKAAMKAGKSTGIVTTARVTHASPAGAFGQLSYRNWESDKDIGANCTSQQCACTDLAKQLALENLDISVIIGGGQEKFYNETEKLPSDNSKTGERLDGLNLPDIWLAKQKKKNRRATVVANATDFMNFDPTSADYLLALLYPSHFPLKLDRQIGQPSLADCTIKAIKMLQSNPKGYFLFVEGAQIDLAHHTNNAKRSLNELVDFEEAISAVAKLVDLNETLLLVTADHSHSFELVGQPSRFQSVFLPEDFYGNQTLDKRSMLAAAYMNGPGAAVNGARSNISELTEAQLKANAFKQQALVPLNFSSHGGDDVPVYTAGPFSFLFSRTMDVTYIAQGIKFALCVEPYVNEEHCGARQITVATFTLLFAWLVGWL